MADEVIISEYKRPNIVVQGGVAPVYGVLVTTQVVDIATRSAAMNASTALVRLQSKATGFWYKRGDVTVSAAADTNGNSWLPADQAIDLQVDGTNTHIDTAVDA